MTVVQAEPALGLVEDEAITRLRVAVVGAGAQATTHLIPTLLRLPRVELVAVCDENTARGAALRVDLW
jgi:predicted dehydrogenase